MGYKIHYPIKEKRKTTLKIFRGGADDSMCPICLEDFEQSEINTNETIRCESCFQHFHYDCIKHWCESSNRWDSIQNSVCPICRQSNICRNSNFVRRESEAARIRRGIRDGRMQTPSEISDIILSIGSEYRIRDNIGLTDLMYLDENWKFNRLNSENENERNENMTNWVADHLDKFINDMNNSAPNPESQWDIADNRAENARIFREEVQRATFNRDLPVWFIAPRPEDSLDIQHLRDLHQLKMFTYNEYNRLKRDYPVYSYLELLFSAEKRKINNERRVAKRKLIRISLRIFLYTMILVKKDTVSRGLTVDPVDMVEDSSESESETETETISTQTQTQAESETGSQTQEDTPVPEPDDGEVAEPQEDTPVPEPDNEEVAEPQEDTPVPEPDDGEVAEPQEGEENVVENDARFDWIPVEENPVEASAVEEAPMTRNEAERPRARGWRLPRVQPPGLRVEREPDGTVLFRWRLPRVQPQEEETLGDGGDRILASRRATVAAQLREVAANRRFAESQRQIADLERRRQQIAENIPQEDTPEESTETPANIVGGADDKKCPICLEDFSESETDGNETIQCNVCGQNYHHNCIREWCVSGTNIGCPSCRDTDICKNNDLNPEPPSIANMVNEPQSIANIVNSEATAHSRFFIIEHDSLFERAQQINNLDTYDCRGIVLYILSYYIRLEESRNNSEESTIRSAIRLDNARIFQQEVRGDLEWFTTPRLEGSLDIRCLWDMYALMMNIYNEYIQLQELPQTSRWQRLISRQQRNVHKKRKRIRLKLRNFQRDIFSFGLILVKRENFSSVGSDSQDGGAGDLPNDRKELKEMCAKAGLPYSSKEPIERIKKRLTAPRGAAYGGFINSLHELLTNQKYSNIISWENDNDGNFLIVLKDNLLVAKELCPKANSEEGKKKTRYLSRSVQAMKDQFRSYDFNRISNRGENELVFSNPKVKSIDDILTLRGEQSRANQAARRRTRRKARLAVDEQGEPTNRPPRRAASTRLRYVESSSEEESADMAAMAVPRHVLLELDEQGDMHSVGEESADMADMAAPRHVLLELDEQGDLHSVGEESTDVDNNEAANVLASIANINDENTEDLGRRTSYLQNLNTNNEHSLKIALLIESLKNHFIDENEQNQIKQKQNELWQGLKEIPMEDEQRRGVLYKYMFEYLKRIIPQAKLNEGAKIAQSNFESIKRAQIHNRPTEPLTESEQKQADEEMNAAISRGQMLAQDEDTNMEDVQSDAHLREASQSGGVIYVDDENDKMRFECPISTEIMNEPVIAEDGYSYEKEEIVNWIKLSEDKGNPITSPITGDNMGKTLIPNTVLKDIIENSIFDRQHTNQESSSQIEDENKNKGIVIQYKDTRFGFIHTFDGIDNLFFHSSQLDNQIIVGDIVSFVIKEYKGKPTATNIKLIEPAWNRKTGVIVKYNNDKQYGFIKSNINGMPEVFVHISEINQLVSVGDKVSFIIGKNMAGKAVAKKVKIINDEIGVEEEKKEDSEIPQLEQRLLMDLIFERDRIMREREKVNSMIKSRK